jgi:hypothetical protein
MSFRGLVVALAVPASLAIAPAASGAVQLIGVSSPVHAGDYATLTARVSPARSCSITVHYKSGPSRARGLYPKRPSASRVSWTWKVGTNTTPGRWRITLSCGSAGMLRTSFVVR